MHSEFQYPGIAGIAWRAIAVCQCSESTLRQAAAAQKHQQTNRHSYNGIGLDVELVGRRVG